MRLERRSRYCGHYKKPKHSTQRPNKHTKAQYPKSQTRKEDLCFGKFMFCLDTGRVCVLWSFRHILVFLSKLYYSGPMVVRMRSTKSHRNNRRSHFRVSAPRFSVCESCGKPRLSHSLCTQCGKYRGRVLIDVQAKIDKKLKKQKDREKQRA